MRLKVAISVIWAAVKGSTAIIPRTAYMLTSIPEMIGRAASGGRFSRPIRGFSSGSILSNQPPHSNNATTRETGMTIRHIQMKLRQPALMPATRPVIILEFGADIDKGKSRPHTTNNPILRIDQYFQYLTAPAHWIIGLLVVLAVFAVFRISASCD